MKKNVRTAVACCVLTAAFAASPTLAGTQQEKMKTCNATAKEKALKGDERKAFMKQCLSNKPAAPQAQNQKERMAVCNKSAGEKNLKGQERQDFMSQCLKGA